MKNRIAVIADIHGNLPAFRAIVNDMESNNIDQVIIAGDIITDCPDSDEVLAIVRESDWTVIKGNREQYYLDHRAGLKEHWTHARQMSALMWTFDRLGRKNRKFIETLKDQVCLKIQNLNIRVVHGSPDSISELILPADKRERFNAIMRDLEEDILICGHSHEQWDSACHGKRAFNPGSAGVHFNSRKSAEYAILTIEDDIPEVEHRLVPYNLDELERRFYESGLYEASPHWSRSILRSLRESRNLSLEMIAFALELMEREGITDSLTIPDRIWDRAGREYSINRD